MKSKVQSLKSKVSSRGCRAGSWALVFHVFEVGARSKPQRRAARLSSLRPSRLCGFVASPDVVPASRHRGDSRKEAVL